MAWRAVQSATELPISQSAALVSLCLKLSDFWAIKQGHAVYTVNDCRCTHVTWPSADLEGFLYCATTETTFDFLAHLCYSIDSTMAPRYMDYDDFGNYSNFFHWSNNFIVIFSFKLWKLFNCFTIELTICLLIFHRNWTARRHDYPFSRWRRGSFSGRHWETDRVGGGSAAVPAASSGFWSWWCTTWRTGAGGRRWVIECDTWFQLFQ